MEEIWKDIEGYEGRYQISNLGRVKSFAHDRVNGRIRKPVINHDGYPTVQLHDKGELKTITVHRLVALAFVDNPYGYTQVNHKDENKTNNSADNLEWCDRKYNNNYGTRNVRIAKANKNNPAYSCKVYSVDESGKKQFFDSIQEASRVLGCSPGNIGKALNGRAHRIAGRSWFYCDGYENGIKQKGISINGKPVEAYNPVTGKRLLFKSAREASSYFGVCESAVSKWLLHINRPSNGYIFNAVQTLDMEVKAS